jgi:hypothetical protein
MVDIASKVMSYRRSPGYTVIPVINAPVRPVGKIVPDQLVMRDTHAIVVIDQHVIGLASIIRSREGHPSICVIIEHLNG